MVKVVVQHHVADYDVWHPVFTEHEAARRKHGATGHTLLRANDDPNTLVVVTDFAGADGARALMADPTLREAMSRGGVDSEPRVWLCDEVETKSYS